MNARPRSVANRDPLAGQPSAAGTQRRHAWWADLSLFVTACIWGINIPVVKFAIERVEPLAFNASRMVLSTITLGVLAWLETYWTVVDPTRPPGERASWSRIVTFALTSGLIYPLLFMFGVARTTSGNTALLLSSMPMWTAILSWLVLRERLPRVTWIGLFITFLGTVIVTGARGDVDLSDKFLGNLLVLAAAVSWAGGTVMSTPILRSISPLQLAFFASLITTPIHVVLYWDSIVTIIPQLLSRPLIYFLCYSGILSTGVAYATWHVGVRALGGSHAAVYQNVVTLVAVLGGWLALGEQPQTAQIVGGLLVVAGLLVMRRGRRAIRAS